MPHNTFRVLSIDFDVFQKISDTNVFAYYPDGLDMPTPISAYIWAQHYAIQAEANLLHTVTIDRSALDNAQTMIVNRCSCDTPTMIVNSHINIYDWIFKHYDAAVFDSIDIVHLDMHHDCFNQNDKLDCGNWIRHVKQRVPSTTVHWICNPVSKSVYDIADDPAFNAVNSDMTPYLDGEPFDLLFICRSDNWLPPHLDKYFTEFYHEVMETVETAMVEQSVTKPRSLEHMIKQTKDIIEQYSARTSTDQS